MTENKKTSKNQETPENIPALDFANDYLSIFDSLSTRLKRAYSRTSLWVIIITFLTSGLAVLSPLLNGSFFPEDWVSVLQNIIKALLIALPFIAVALLDYSREFNTSTAWIYFREAAELIRSNTHLFRMKAGKYKNYDDDATRQRELVNEVKKIYDKHKQFDMVDINNKNKKKTVLGQILGLPDTMIDKSIKMFEFMAIAESKDADEIAHAANDIEAYIHERLENQLKWYDRRIKGDYKKLRYSRASIIVLTAITGIVAGFATDVSIVFVALLSSLATTINLISDTLMYGATYSIYDDAMRKLKVIKTEWRIKQQETAEMTDADISQLVEDVEKVLMEELDNWKQGMIKKVESSERAVLNRLNDTTSANANSENNNADTTSANNSNGTSTLNGTTEKVDETTPTAVG